MVLLRDHNFSYHVTAFFKIDFMELRTRCEGPGGLLTTPISWRMSSAPLRRSVQTFNVFFIDLSIRKFLNDISLHLKHTVLRLFKMFHEYSRAPARCRRCSSFATSTSSCSMPDSFEDSRVRRGFRHLQPGVPPEPGSKLTHRYFLFLSQALSLEKGKRVLKRFFLSNSSGKDDFSRPLPPKRRLPEPAEPGTTQLVL